jgi:hypothetical protein
MIRPIQSPGEVSRAPMLRKFFSPGQLVLQTGAYWVHHAFHRPAHLVIAKEGELFPSCRRCNAAVRFEMAADYDEPPGPLEDDPEFISHPKKARKAKSGSRTR